MAKHHDVKGDQRLMAFLSRGLPVPEGTPLAPIGGAAPRKSDPVSLQRAEAQVVALKEAVFITWKRDPSYQSGVGFIPDKFGN